MTLCVIFRSILNNFKLLQIFYKSACEINIDHLDLNMFYLYILYINYNKHIKKDIKYNKSIQMGFRRKLFNLCEDVFHLYLVFQFIVI